MRRSNDDDSQDSKKKDFQITQPVSFCTDLVRDRLILGRRGVLIADLTNKQLLVQPTDNKSKYNQNGLVVREGTGYLLKFVHLGNQGQAIFRFDLRTGELTESTITDQDGSWIAEPQSYGQAYSSPVVLGQVMSENDPAWSTFWCQGATRDASPSPTAAAFPWPGH